MELREYLIPLRKWWWLLVATTVVSTLSALVATQLQDPLYQTKATLMIGQAIEDPNPNNNSIYLTQQLAQSYVQIAQRQPVQERTMAQLGLDWLPEYRVSTVPNTQLLEITVIDSSPVRAQVVANTLAEQLVAQSPTSTQQEDQQRQAFINSQLDSLEAKITETEEQIAELQSDMTNMISARQIADTETQIQTLQDKLNTLQTNYSTLLSNTREGAINTLRIIEPAEAPVRPINSNRLTTVLLGAVIGLTLSSGAAYLMEYLDDTLKTPQEISRELGTPVLGFIADTPGDKADDVGALVAEAPRSPIAEAFRSLRTNLEFAGVDKPLRTILVTSPDPSDGKTTVATNLAIMIAQGGKRVALVDADLRRPRTHRFLGLQNRSGLSDIFRNKAPVTKALQRYEKAGRLAVMTTGNLPPNPAELLGSERMDQILQELTELVDTVIIDSPPFIVADASLLAAKVDGVLLVMQPGQTTAETARAMMDQLERADARVVGVVLNRIPRQGGLYYGGYRYYYAPYYYAGHYYLNGKGGNGEGPAPEQRSKGRLAGLFNRLQGGGAAEET